MSILGSLNQDEEDATQKLVVGEQDRSGYQEVWVGVQREGWKKLNEIKNRIPHM